MRKNTCVYMWGAFVGNDCEKFGIIGLSIRFEAILVLDLSEECVIKIARKRTICIIPTVIQAQLKAIVSDLHPS